MPACSCVTDMALADSSQPLATAARVEATGIEWTWPATLAVDRVVLQKPWAQVEMGSDMLASEVRAFVGVASR